ncbi:MAG: 4Fe-4S binding protein [Coriobacteriia bacterium]|nr:4Fe-4S binding protein [Coriobacteriia bacterium]
MTYERSDRTAQKRSRWLRWGVLGVVLVGLTAIVTAHQYVSGFAKPPGVDALCPFGGIETLFSLLTGAGVIQRVAVSSVILLIGSLAIALVFRRSFCGQICPLGTLQGAFGSLGRRVFKNRPHIPPKVDRIARWLKYVVLAVFAIWTWRAAELVMRPYDPWAAWAHITSAELFTDLAVGVAVLGVSLVGSIVYDRFFCKYLCPMGAVLGVFSKISLFGIKRDADTCIGCKRCDKACPMNIIVSEADTVKSSECISCNECVNACPAAGALVIKAPRGRKASPLFMTGMVTLAIAALIAVTTMTGQFDWRLPSLAEAINASQTTSGSGGASTDPSSGVTSSFDTSLIKGSTSMQEIIDATGIPAAAFTDRWGVPASDLGKSMKDIKTKYVFEPEDVRLWVEEKLAK